jgi:hypothetical protein
MERVGVVLIEPVVAIEEEELLAPEHPHEPSSPPESETENTNASNNHALTFGFGHPFTIHPKTVRWLLHWCLVSRVGIWE